MKLIIRVTLSIMAAFSSSLWADNIYQEGSLGYNLTSRVIDFIPKDLYVIFVANDDRDLFFNDIKQDLLEKSNIVRKKINQARKEAYEMSDITLAYSKIERIPARNSVQTVCTILFKSKKLIEHAYLHELTHCISKSAQENSDFSATVNLFADLDKKTNYGKDVSDMTKKIILNETHSHIFADIIMQKTGLTSDMPAQKSRMKNNYPLSVGKRGSIYGIEKCRAQKCPSDASDLMNSLLRDVRFIKLVQMDIYEASNHATKVAGKIN